MKRQESGKFRTENEEEILYQLNIGDQKRLNHKIFIKLLLLWNLKTH